MSPVVMPGTSGFMDEEAVTSRAVVEREVVDAAAKKAADDVAATKRAAIDKKAVDVAVEEKVAADVAAAEGASPKATTRGTTESSPTPAAGAKRAVVGHCMSFLSLCLFCLTWALHRIVFLLPVGHPPLELFKQSTVPWSMAHRRHTLARI
jgi:cytoskeletal protein RodZ